MCEIGKPLEVIDSQPLVLPAPLRREKQPTEQPVTIEVPVMVSDTAVEPVAITTEKL
jgi:hypothetical protein